MQFASQRRGYCMASDRMLQFVEREQSYPDKRSAEERARDFREIAERYAAPDADAQAARCSQCGVPYCSVHCPLHNHIPGLASPDCRGAPSRSLRTVECNLDDARDLRPHLPAGSPVRRQLRDRIFGPWRGDDR
ncbi:Glutamate synthase [Aphelenchoides bicaudatus]|nr:Glutamate synthase [Aphelenchoides bicaudatus]